jgi:hypothetical protein
MHKQVDDEYVPALMVTAQVTTGHALHQTGRVEAPT